jgi:hypothetical protein
MSKHTRSRAKARRRKGSGGKREREREAVGDDSLRKYQRKGKIKYHTRFLEK